MKISGIKYLTNQGFENIWKNKMMAFATFCVVLISLILVGMAALFYVNLNSMIAGLGSQNEIAVFMDVGSTAEENEAAEEAIRAMANVDTVEFISKEDALARQRATINWTSAGSVTGYEIYRGSSATGTFSKIAVMPSSAGGYSDSNLVSGGTYYYKVRAYDKVGENQFVYGYFSDPKAVTIR